MNLQKIVHLCQFLILSSVTVSIAQIQPIQDFDVQFPTDTVKIVYGGVFPNRGWFQETDVATIDVKNEGFYRIYPHTWYDSGDEQMNESYYLSVLNDDGETLPEDSNAGPYKLVLDIPGLPKDPHSGPVDPSVTVIWRDAGLFYLPAGINTIRMHHYAKIFPEYPEFFQPDSIPLEQRAIPGGSSIRIWDSLKVVAEPEVDALLRISAAAPRTEMVNGALVNVVMPGEQITYTLDVVNNYQNRVRFAELENKLPDHLSFVSATVPPDSTEGQFMKWNLPDIFIGGSFRVEITAELGQNIPPGFTPLVDKAELMVPNDIDSLNNSAIDTSYAKQQSELKVDVGVALKSQTDSTQIVSGDTIRYVPYNGQVDFMISLRNIESDTAKDITIRQVLPEPLQFVSADTPPDSVAGDTLIWLVSQLPGGDILNLNVSANQPLRLGSRLDLISTISAQIDNDSDLTNNVDSETFIALPPPTKKLTDVQLELLSQTDSTLIVDGRLQSAVETGGAIQYTITGRNTGLHPADSLRLVFQLPHNASFTSATPQPALTSADSLVWNPTPIAAGDSSRWFVNLNANQDVADGELITATSTITSPKDSLAANNTKVDTVIAIVPVNMNVDLAIDHTALTDSFVVVGNDTVEAVLEGDAIDYEIQITNRGPRAAQQIALQLSIPDSVTVGNFNIQPDVLSSTQANWVINSLAAGASLSITYTGDTAEDFNSLPYVIVSIAELSTPADTTAENNRDTAPVYVLDRVSTSEQADLTISLASVTDTSVVVDGVPMNAVYSGDVFTFILSLENLGPNAADSMEVTHVLPPFLNYVSSSIDPVVVIGSGDAVEKQITWTFTDLAASATRNWTVVTSVAADIAPSILPLTRMSQATVKARVDINAANNADEEPIRILSPVTPDEFNMSISMQVVSDTSVTRNGVSYPAVWTNQPFKSQINVHNLGPAQNATVVLPLTSDINFISAVPEPSVVTPDSLVWTLDAMPMDRDTTLFVNLSGTMRTEDSRTINVRVVPETDVAPGDNQAQETVWFLVPVGSTNYDVSLGLTITADSSIVQSGQSYPAVVQGDSATFELSVQNLGPRTANNIAVIMQQSDVALINLNYSIEPDTQAGDSVIWNLSSLAAGGRWTVNYAATTQGPFSSFPFALFHTARVVAASDTNASNDAALNQWFALEKQIQPLFADVSVLQKVETDSFAILNSDTLWYAKEAESFGYNIVISNSNTVDAQNVLVRNVYDTTLSISNITPPATVRQDSIIWQIATLPAGSEWRLRFDAKVPDRMPVGAHEFINTVQVSAANEGSGQTGNNTSIVSVYNEVEAGAPFTPLIEVSPQGIDITDSVHVRVQFPQEVESWDVWIYLPDGTIITDFGDNFIQNTSIQPGQWYEFDVLFFQDNLIDPEGIDEIIFEVRARGRRNNEGVNRAVVLIKSTDELFLDRNVYRSESQGPLSIRFKVRASSEVSLDVYDIAGRHITNLSNQTFSGGWHSYSWDGRTAEGVKVGSGVYLVTKRSKYSNTYKKVIIVR